MSRRRDWDKVGRERRAYTNGATRAGGEGWAPGDTGDKKLTPLEKAVEDAEKRVQRDGPESRWPKCPQCRSKVRPSIRDLHVYSCRRNARLARRGKHSR